MFHCARQHMHILLCPKILKNRSNPNKIGLFKIFFIKNSYFVYISNFFLQNANLFNFFWEGGGRCFDMHPIKTGFIRKLLRLYTISSSEDLSSHKIVWALKKMGHFEPVNPYYVFLFLCLVLDSLVLFCHGGTTSSYVRRLEATVDMPLNSDVFRVPLGWNAPQQVRITFPLSNQQSFMSFDMVSLLSIFFSLVIMEKQPYNGCS